MSYKGTMNIIYECIGPALLDLDKHIVIGEYYHVTQHTVQLLNFYSGYGDYDSMNVGQYPSRSTKTHCL